MHPKFLIFKLLNVSNKDVASICKRLLCSTTNKRNKEFQYVLKNLVYPKTFFLNSFLLLTSKSLKNLQYRTTINRYRNRYILNRKNYLHWGRVAAYLYSHVTKLLLTSRKMNYPRKNLIYLKLYTFWSNQIKLENLKYLLPLKRFIVFLLTTLNTRKPKVR